jgi:hypothetical protein
MDVVLFHGGKVMKNKCGNLNNTSFSFAGWAKNANFDAIKSQQ